MTIRSFASLLVVLPTAGVIAQSGQPAPHATSQARVCLAPSSVQTAIGSADNAVSAVRETFASFLSGPTLTVTPLSSRLESQAREEAKAGKCPYVLFTSIKHTRKGGGMFNRVAMGAVQSGAYAIGSTTSSTVERVATNAAAGAASAAAASYNYASLVKTQDELVLTSRLESSTGQVLLDRTDKRKAKSDGEDLVTPLAQNASEAVAGIVTKRNP